MWKLSGISIAVHDLELSEHFYGNVLGLGLPKEKDTSNLIFTSPHSVLRLSKPSNRLIKNENSVFKSALHKYVMLEISDLERAEELLVTNGADFQKLSGIKGEADSLCISLPCQNIFIVCEASCKNFEEDIEQVNFESWKLHHVNIQASDVRKSVEFVSENLGLKEGDWRAPARKGDFSIKPSDLSVFPLGSFNGGLHIIKPDPGFAFRNNFAHNPSIGGHPAIIVQNIQEIINRLRKEDVLITDAGRYAMADMHQIYCLDPSGNIVEVNQYHPH